MAIFNLTPKQVQILKDCIEVGLAGARENHTDIGDENTTEDLAAIDGIAWNLVICAQANRGAKLVVDFAETIASPEPWPQENWITGQSLTPRP